MKRVLILFTFICIFTGVMSCSVAIAEDSLALLHRFRGDVTVVSQGIQREPSLRMELFNEDLVTTKQGNAEILFNDGSLVKLRSHTELQIVDTVQADERDVKIKFGRVWFNVKDGAKATKFSGPTSVAAIRGTIGEIAIHRITQIAQYGCVEGKFCVYADVFGQMFVVCLTKGFFTIVYPNQKPLDPMQYIIGQIAGSEDIMFQEYFLMPRSSRETGGSRGRPASPSGRP